MEVKLPDINRSSLTKWAVIAILVVIAYFIIRKAIKSIKADAYQKSIAAEIKQNELSYPLNQYVTFAAQLTEAMAYLGTDDSAVRAIFQKMNTLSDLLQLIKAFGSPNYYPFWGAKTLPEWLLLELSDNERAKLNTILQNKGINFSF